MAEFHIRTNKSNVYSHIDVYTHLHFMHTTLWRLSNGKQERFERSNEMITNVCMQSITG